jgi:glycosyltransferase involved in cell wall biosynthesis
MKRVALVHDWFTTFAGSEQVVRQILSVFPEAELYSLIDFLSEKDRSRLDHRKIHTSFLQTAPWIKKYYRYYLPLMPMAIERLDLSAYDLILSSCHAVSKGVTCRPDQLHISYIHTPIRYVWDMQDDYLNSGGLRDVIARFVFQFIRRWDVVAAQPPHRLIANSRFVAERIRKTYQREAEVIYPPVDVDYFFPGMPRENFYLAASRLAPYKRVDLITRAFQSMPEKKLVIIGDGEQASQIKNLAGPNISWLGYQPDEVLKSHMQRCRAFVFAGVEDFGITLLEAQACGAPVIAYGAGGAKETIQNLDHAHPTGVLYKEQTVAGIQEAVREFERKQDRITLEACRKNAERFSSERFRKEFREFTYAVWEDFHSKQAGLVRGR